MFMQRFLALLLLSWASGLAQGDDTLDKRFPVRGFCIGAPSPSQVDRFVHFINEDLAPRAVNTLILRVDYNFQYVSHPELPGRDALSKADVQKIVAACKEHKIHVIPQINLLGHQSWANRNGALLRAYPEFDETPWVKMPEKYAWPNADGLYCKSYCPLHPKVHEVVFALIDEICDAFETDAFHGGMDEVFYIGGEKCPRCSGRDKAGLFADEVARIRDHLAQKGRTLWIWADRLLDGKTTGLGEWEASMNGTWRSVDLVPKDVVLCDWHYNRADPTAAYLALKGFRVVTCPWNNPTSAVQQVHDIVRLRTQSTRQVRDRVIGLVQTVWSGANSFLDDYDGLKNGTPKRQGDKTEAKCFVKAFDEIHALATDPSSVQTPAPAATRALVLAEEGDQHQEFVKAARIWLGDFAEKHEFQFDYLQDTKEINAASLERYQVFIQLNYPPYRWTPEATNAFREYIEQGKGGWVGLHHATLLGEFDGYSMWPWFSDFMGGIRFKNYIASFVSGNLQIEDRSHPIMRGLPENFRIAREEFYTYNRSPRPQVHVLASVDEHSYEPASAITMGDHPVVWTNEKLPARNVYIFMGHGPDLLENKNYTALLRNSILWAAGRESL
jgi:type 1 glutamine amidotransferase